MELYEAGADGGFCDGDADLCTPVATETPTATGSPAAFPESVTFDNLKPGKYRARGRGCSGGVCGAWSAWSNTIDHIAPPTGLALKSSRDGQLGVHYTRVDIPDAGWHEFALYQADTDGKFCDACDALTIVPQPAARATPGENTEAPTLFGLQPERAYKARAQSCIAGGPGPGGVPADNCGAWSDFTPVIYHIRPPAELGLVSSNGNLGVSFRSLRAARFQLYKSSGSACTVGAAGCTLVATITAEAEASAGPHTATFGQRTGGTYWVRGQSCLTSSARSSGGVGGAADTPAPRVDTGACGAWSALSPSSSHTASTSTPAPTYRLTVEASPSSCGSARGTGDYIEGREVSIRASVKTNADCRFRNWTGDDIVNASSSSATVTMGNAPKTVTANFERIKYKLTIDISPPGCGRARGADDYAGGTPVSIRASANPGCRFDKWTGDGIVNASSSSATVTMGNAPKTITAHFVATTCTLTVVASPPKGGNATPATKTYSPCPSHKDLLATANPGYEFSSWTGDVSSASRSARVTLKDGVSKTVTANFTPTIKCPRDVFHTFEVNRNNSETLSAVTDGSGTITYSDGTGRPAWLGFTASTRTISGTPPRAGAWLFSIVATDADSNAVTCPYLVQAMKIPYTVTATVSPNAAWGSVSKSPAGRYYYGDSVTLTATASAGYRFVRWSGDASGSSTTARVTVKDDVEVTATFAARTYTLSVSVTKTASGYLHGSVTRTPWKAAYAYNDRVTLRANATPGYRFVKWSGAASGTSTTARIIMNGSKAAKAHFELIPLPPCDPSVPGSCACPPGFPICGNAGDEGG